MSKTTKEIASHCGLLLTPGAFLFRHLFDVTVFQNARKILFALWLAEEPLTARQLNEATGICLTAIHYNCSAMADKIVKAEKVDDNGRLEYSIMEEQKSRLELAWNLKAKFVADGTEGDDFLSSYLGSLESQPSGFSASAC